jgi:hypothetical protein
VAVRVIDRGASRVLRELGATGPAVEVGVIGDAAGASALGGVTVAQVAEWLELGTATVPARSWLRGYVDEHEAEIQARVSLEMRAVLSGSRTREQALARVGIWIVGQIQERISRGIAPPNAPSTIARKGSSTPLINTGQLRSSITSRVVR